ncbi:hypothetical protein [Geotoga petraea]|jgi:hypothetical protein|uniref:Uncharacterized protein n=1 Tax=Geotoga petraea TaxID=28234 RepID=A0A1G6N2H4_9BACT|nr:hypothetical protein [Geotoga petraea]MDK2945925.1 hypothetical protein [Geotoga sp.]TGG87277.1 hypothetical protein E4650_08200 [Geotoga petraea]SDC61335.1 hypothetical protein SAMN04488588_1452 [Geotoga petraea]
MKIFAGNPVNSLEFDQITYTISTESWSFSDWDSVCTVLDKDNLYLYFKDKKYEINNENFLFNINGTKIIYGKFYESLNNNFYLYSSLIRTDLVVLHLKILNADNILKMLETIKSYVYFYKLPTLVLMRNGLNIKLYNYYIKENKVSYESEHYFVLDIDKNNKFVVLNKEKEILIKKYSRYIKEVERNVDKKV